MGFDLDFFKDKKIFITGHTGFKGSWLSEILFLLGAKVKGYALEPDMNNNLFTKLKLENKIESVIGDIRDFEKLEYEFSVFNPDIAIHLAAQPLVLDSYINPKYTYEVNVIGTINFLEVVRKSNSLKSVLNVTTDKVYKNNEWHWGYRENDVLDGFDPYSNSKSCSELITRTYKRSFLSEKNIAVSTARAGNVIGGGDFSENRIIPDAVKYASINQSILIRNPNSIRPYQHVLEPLFAYLLIIQKQYYNIEFSDEYNVGPLEEDCVTTEKLVTSFCEKWGKNTGYKVNKVKNFHEANFLKLDCSKITNRLRWKPIWNLDKTMNKVVDWYKAELNNKDILEITDEQINQFIKDVMIRWN